MTDSKLVLRGSAQTNHFLSNILKRLADNKKKLLADRSNIIIHKDQNYKKLMELLIGLENF